MFDKINNNSANTEDVNISENENVQTYGKIKVIGVGGGGCNAVKNMIESEIMGVEFWVCNTDSQALENSICENKLILGANTTKGLGAGADPKVGYEAAEESKEQIKNMVQGADMIFITCGMGGGTGTGASPLIAKIAKEMDILTIGCVTKPFDFEGRRRKNNATVGIQNLLKSIDSVIIVSNQKLMETIGHLSAKESFLEADKTLMQAVQTITDLIILPADIHLDFADVKTVMKDKGIALIGVGLGEGENRARDAATQAIDSPLLDSSINGAKLALINITSANATLNEIQEAIEIIKKAANSDIDIIYGMAFNKNMENEMVVSIIATGFDEADINFTNNDSNNNSKNKNKSKNKDDLNSDENNDYMDDDNDIDLDNLNFSSPYEIKDNLKTKIKKQKKIKIQNKTLKNNFKSNNLNSNNEKLNLKQMLSDQENVISNVREELLKKAKIQMQSNIKTGKWKSYAKIAEKKRNYFDKTNDHNEIPSFLRRK